MAVKKSLYVFLVAFICNIYRVENILPPSYKATAPFMAYLHRSDNHFCGGVILNKYVVLSAGHCISSQMNVTAGGRYMAQHTSQTVDVQKTLLHEDYLLNPNGIQAYNDVGLLLLSKPFELNSHIQPIEWSNQIDFLKNVTIYGWGSTNAFVKNPSFYLRVRNISLIPDNLCIEMLNNTITKCEKQIYELCVEKSCCFGDSGSPMVQTIGNETKLIGIMSWGADDNINCNTSPHVFENVVHFADWIEVGIRSLLSETMTPTPMPTENIADQDNVVQQY